jgi:diguanylate cyclase (GGDEF)-like protein
MMELLNLPRILEVSFGLLNAATGIVVLLLARRIAPTLTLYMHQRVMQILVIIAGLIVLSEFVGILQPFFRSSTFADVAEELAELLAISSGGFALCLMSRARRGRLFEAIGGHGRPLTGVSSRAFFRRAAVRRIELSKNNDLPLSCAVIDVDDFKPYNDRYGHQAGDEALRCVARVLRESARADDLSARYGGEEFVLLMNSDVEDAVEVAERVRRVVEYECSPERDASLSCQITVSLGIASLAADTQTLEQLIEAAGQGDVPRQKGGQE